MLKAIQKSISSHYHIEAKHDFFKIIGLHIFIALGLLSGLAMFLIDLLGYSVDECLPGDISMLIVFGISLYGLRNISYNWAIRVFFLVPVIPYFFFISGSFAIFPYQESIGYSLWTLIPFFLFFIIFSNHKKDLLIFFGLSVLLLTVHTYQAGLINLLFLLKWNVGGVSINPLIVFFGYFAAAFLIALNFRNTIDDLKKIQQNTEQIINQTIRGLPQGMMLLETAKDEFGTASHLIVRRTNIAFERQFRITSRELKDQNADDVLPKIFRGAFDWNKQLLKSKNTDFSFHLDHLDKHFDVNIIRISSTQTACLFIDVTVKHNMIIELEENKHRYQVLLEAVPDLFFQIDKDGIYVDFVFKASEGLKIKPEDIIGNSIFEVGFSEKMSSKIFQCIQHCIEFDSIETIEYALDIEGSSALFEMRIARLNENSVIALARDITIRKIAEIKMEEARNKAEESDRLKTAFLANISHEIRTPMNAIIGFSKMIGSPEFDDEEKDKFIEIIITNGKILMTLINDMISLSKIESNTLVVKKQACRVNDIIVALYKEFSYDLEDKGNVKLKVSSPNSNPKFTINTDPVLLQSILQKLIDNGIKFTEQGEVEFGYRIASLDKLEFFVRDTGIGIAQKDTERIFERFHQLDNRTTRAYDGTGLGLSIAQHYVRLLGGTLAVNSKEGIGSTFSFEISYIRDESPLKIVR